jgi:hypothetical protein
MTTPARCLVCRAGSTRQDMVAALWSEGMTAKGIAAQMADAGWNLTANVILGHLKEHVDGAAGRKPPAMRDHRDAAIFVRDRIMDRLQEEPTRQVVGKDGEIEEVPFDILDKDLQPALNSMLKAESIIQKRSANETKVGVLLLMLGGDDGRGFLAPPQLTAGPDDSDIEFEGEAVEVE